MANRCPFPLRRFPVWTIAVVVVEDPKDEMILMAEIKVVTAVDPVEEGAVVMIKDILLICHLPGCRGNSKDNRGNIVKIVLDQDRAEMHATTIREAVKETIGGQTSLQTIQGAPQCVAILMMARRTIVS